jgi:hypothetical protein
MLTDEELTTRLQIVLRESVPEMTYNGRVPRVHRRGTGLVATSVLAAAAALALTPTMLHGGDAPSPQVTPTVSPQTHPTTGTGRATMHTTNFGGLRLSYAAVDGDERGPLYLVGGPDLRVPPDAVRWDIDSPVEVWFDPHAANGRPQVYSVSHACPDTVGGCADYSGPYVWGLLAPGWTRDQLFELFQHPLRYERGSDAGDSSP